MENKVIKCRNCSGTGRINERWVEEYHNTSWIPTQSEKVEVHKYDKCPDCDGTGELILKFVPNKN